MKKAILSLVMTISVIAGYGQIYEEQAKTFFSKFKNTTEVKTAINSLITHLKSINVESLVNDEDY